MKITLLAEGKTERAFKPVLLKFLETKLAGQMPKLHFSIYDGRIPTGEKLRRIVIRELTPAGEADFVIALTDIYTGKMDFADAHDAKAKMTEWVGDEPRFFPHAAQHDFEAWLIPYWDDIKSLTGVNKARPSSNPESINHGSPPAHRLKEIFEISKKRGSYVKARDALRILRDKDLSVTISQCPELKSFVSRIIQLSGGDVLQ